MSNATAVIFTAGLKEPNPQITFNYIPENALRKLVDSLPIYMYSVLYKDGIAVETYHSPQCAVITGYNPVDYETDPSLWLKMICEDDREKVLDFFNQLQKRTPHHSKKSNGGGKGHAWGEAIEHRLVHEDGSMIWVLNHCTPSFDEEGRVTRLDGMVIDISDQKWGHEELIRQLDREVKLAADTEAAKKHAEDALEINEKFVSIATHDLRAPLSSIITMSRLLNNNYHALSEAERDALVDKIGSIGENMLEMVDDLLDLTRLRSGQMRLSCKFFCASNTSTEVMESLRPYAEAKQVRLVNLIPPGTRLLADRRLYSEILRNLLSNAIKFCGTGDYFSTQRTYTVETGVRKENGRIIFYVKDDGPGIKAELVPDLFKYNVRTSTTGTAGEKGTGFGLPFCYEAVNALDGAISVETQLGKGSKFWLTFQDRKPAVLIADDDPARRDRLGGYLKALNLDVILVGDKNNALEALGQKETHLALAPVKSQGMNGVELLRDVREQTRLKKLPLVLYLLEKDETTGQDLTPYDNFDVVAWPDDPGVVSSIVRRHIG